MRKNFFMVLILMFLLTGCGNKSFKDEYPETLPDTVVWTEYPDGNIMGLCGMGTCDDQGTSTIILVFAPSKAEVNKKIFLKPEYLQGACPYGYFQFDENSIYEKAAHDYVKLCYDSRITLTDIIFEKDDERCVICIGDKTDLFYLNMKNLDKVKRLSQSYDPAAMAWSDANEETKDETPTVSTGHSEYYKLAIDNSEYDPSKTTDGVTFTAVNYNHVMDKYNIYGEVEEAGVTTLRFGLSCDQDSITEQDSFRLYRKEAGVYIDITPADVSLKTNSQNNDHYLSLYMQSSDIGELAEGDYRAEYGNYSVDFRISELLFIVD